MPTLLSIEALEADRRYVERLLAEAESENLGTARLMWANRLKEIKNQIVAEAARPAAQAPEAEIVRLAKAR